jgi:hypothetical protein
MKMDRYDAFGKDLDIAVFRANLAIWLSLGSLVLWLFVFIIWLTE